jgi:hypothetical protein
VKSAFYAFVCFAAATCASLPASTPTFDRAIVLDDWMTLGRVVRKTVKDLQIGPSYGSDAISGIRSKVPAQPTKKIDLQVSMGSFAVTVPAPDELDNENDIRINIVLSPDSAPAWENNKAVVNVILFFNSRHGGVFAGIFGKGANLAQQGTKPLSAGAFLGEGFMNGDIAVQIAIDERGITAEFSRGGVFLNALQAPLDGDLASLLSEPVYTSVYQQNIGKGTGSFTLQSVAWK